MTDEPAAIEASFADFRIIKTRKQAQLIFEVPLEQADAALATLGGLPQPHAERRVAVARLNDSATPEPKPDKEKQRWEDLKLSMQAGIRCEELAFKVFMKEMSPGWFTYGNEGAAGAVRQYCDVDSRSGLNDNPEAAEKWRQLDRSYQAWLKVAE